MKPIIGAHADFHPHDYRFPRMRTGHLQLERSSPIAGWGADLLTAALIVALVVGVTFLLWAVNPVGAP